jgi:hypothetical protein
VAAVAIANGKPDDDKVDADADAAAPAVHGVPTGECIFCCEDLDSEIYAEYRGEACGPWLPSGYCRECLEEFFIKQQWQKYVDDLAKADCAAALRRSLAKPPPVNVADKGLPLPDTTSTGTKATGEVHSFWWCNTDTVVSAKLDGSITGSVLLWIVFYLSFK